MTKEELKEIEERLERARIYLGDHCLRKKDGSFEAHASFDPDYILTDSIHDVLSLLCYIKELESQIPRWIPVDERLPEDSGYYLCLDIGIMESDESCLFIYYFDANLKEFAPGADVLITYWMPIPKGPEEK